MPRAITAPPFDARVDLDLGSFLLRRRGVVAVDPEELLPAADPWSTRGLVALDADLVGRGYLLTTQLRATLARLAPIRLAELGDGLLARIDHLLGADREHLPLFRRFPDAVPDHAHVLYSRRIRALLLNQPRQTCAHCGRRSTEAGIGALAPCAHLLCAPCLDGLEAQGRGARCPLCGTGLSAGTYLGEDSSAGRKAAEVSGLDQALRPLRLVSASQLAAAMAEFHRLLARRTPLSPQDRDDLAALLAHAPADLPQRLPERIPLRETKAAVLAALLRRDGAGALPVLAERIDTATDVLRLLWSWSGAEPDLLPATARRLRLRNVPRPLRRGLLEILEALPQATLFEDLRRHRSAWLRAGELLHPYEHRSRFPRVTAAFVLLRETDLRTHEVGREFAEPPAPLRVVEAGEHTRLGFTGFAGRVETRLAAGDAAGAVRVLAARPGELVRRLHHVLRVHAATAPGAPLPDGLAETVAAALARVAPGPLLGAYGRLRGARTAGERRLYFPRGTVSLAHAKEDHGTVVPAELSDPVCALIEAELLRRGAAGGERYELALLDEGLVDLVAPFAERAAAKTLVSVPRGSRQPLPPGDRLRLFVHWMQPEHLRVDLDLSVALYDARWNFHGLCDYTNLVHGERAAVHSGDFTTAPPPDGATEFVDLDLDRLERGGARYAVVIVFSYNDVPFEDLDEAFAGFLDLGATPAGGRHYHPRAVRQRLDLQGDAKVSVPMIVDLADRRYTWTDLNTGADGGFHSVYRHQAEVGALSRDVLAHFSPENRATLWDVACARAAACTDEVAVRGADGARRWRRGAAETVEEFAARLRALRDPDGAVAGPLTDLLAGRRAFVALVNGDVPAPEKAAGTLYRLYPGPVDAAGEELERWTAGDLVSALTPG
ncbi:MXAN_6230/SCO0854 family RING domain-containing protein [Streptomyces sp. Y1]|uniref:MXAN_6230/SCO0854 family RING domain-containing protein n=1 Tax=Streptomyces sp. Y1 TaxID=3238634 RepID=A0AB39TJN3_9ACTN